MKRRRIQYNVRLYIKISKIVNHYISFFFISTWIFFFYTFSKVAFPRYIRYYIYVVYFYKYLTRVSNVWDSEVRAHGRYVHHGQYTVFNIIPSIILQRRKYDFFLDGGGGRGKFKGIFKIFILYIWNSYWGNKTNAPVIWIYRYIYIYYIFVKTSSNLNNTLYDTIRNTYGRKPCRIFSYAISSRFIQTE